MPRRQPARRHAVMLGAVTGAAFLVAAATPSGAQAPNPQAVQAQEEGLAFRADAESLCALVGKMQVIAFRYGSDPVAAELRELQPYAVGYTKQRKVLLFGRQVRGYSKSAAATAPASAAEGAGGLPGWRNFRIDKIDRGIINARVTTFEPVRPDPGEHRYITEFVCRNEFVQ